MNLNHVTGGVASLLMLIASLSPLAAAAATKPQEETSNSSIRDRIAAVQSTLMQNSDTVSRIDPRTLLAGWGDYWGKTIRRPVTWTKIIIRRS